MPDRLITRPAASLERKVVGGGLVGLLTVLALAALRYYYPEEADDLSPFVEGAIAYAATMLGAYFTRSRMPVPVTGSEPVEP